jgi:RHS repeat-associated protein
VLLPSCHVQLLETKSLSYELVQITGHSKWSTTPQNTLGRLAATLTSTSSYTTRSELSYDISGDVTTMWQCAPSICGTSNQEGRPPLQFTYDSGGALISEADGVTGTISFTRSMAEEPTSVTNQGYHDQYNPGNLVSSITNGRFGPTNYLLGNGTSIVSEYDSLGRNNGGWLCTGSSGQGSAAFCTGNGTQLYGFLATYSGSEVTGVCDTVVNQCQNNGYDELNRLNAVNGSSSSTWTYDRWGNRLTQSGSPSVSFSFDSNTNRNISFTYDAAGNQVNDASHTYSYDAEGNVLQVDGGSTATYVYDAFNQRVKVQTASSASEYLFDPSGRRVSSWLLNGSPAGFGDEGRIWWDGGLLATRDFNGTTYFHHSNWLGTERMRTDYQGQVATTSPSLAFGDGFSQSSSDQYGAAQDNNEFAGQDHDAETDTEHAQYRQYAATQGRWMSPDPYDGSYSFGNPQSMNRYTYVLNNPFSFIDPLGLDGCTIYTLLNSDGMVVSQDTVCTITSSGGDDGGGDGADGSGAAADGGSGPAIGIGIGGTGRTAGGGGRAPNNGTPRTPSQCAGAALKKNAVALTLDAAGIGAGFLPGGELVVAGVQATISVASGVNSATHGDAGGSVLGVLGLPATFTGYAAKALGAGGRYLPYVGSIVSAAGAISDGYGAYQDYKACLAGG